MIKRQMFGRAGLPLAQVSPRGMQRLELAQQLEYLGVAGQPLEQDPPGPSKFYLFFTSTVHFGDALIVYLPRHP